MLFKLVLIYINRSGIYIYLTICCIISNFIKWRCFFHSIGPHVKVISSGIHFLSCLHTKHGTHENHFSFAMPTIFVININQLELNKYWIPSQYWYFNAKQSILLFFLVELNFQWIIFHVKSHYNFHNNKYK